VERLAGLGELLGKRHLAPRLVYAARRTRLPGAFIVRPTVTGQSQRRQPCYASVAAWIRRSWL
jgi:hypothetical protein